MGHIMDFLTYPWATWQYLASFCHLIHAMPCCTKRGVRVERAKRERRVRGERVRELKYLREERKYMV